MTEGRLNKQANTDNRFVLINNNLSWNLIIKIGENTLAAFNL